MTKKTVEKLSEASLKRRYIRPTLLARGPLQRLTGEDSLGTPILSDAE